MKEIEVISNNNINRCFSIVGYVPKKESMMTCQTQKNWMPNPANLACVEAVALNIGGKLRWGRTGVKRIEVYGPSTFMALHSFVSGSWGQALFYHERKVIMCGGCSETTAMSCLKGEFLKEKGGSIRI